MHWRLSSSRRRARIGAPCLTFLSTTPPNCSTTCLAKRFPALCNSIIRASIEKGTPQKALQHYRTMLLYDAFRPDQRSLALVLKACRISSDLDAATVTHARIMKSGFQSDGFVASSLFQFYIDNGRAADAQLLLDEILKWEFNPVYGNLVLHRLLGDGEFERASRLFNALPIRDVVTWNSVIAGSVRNSRPREAISYFRRMVRSGVEPDCFTFSSMMSACARVGALSSGEWVHRMMLEKRIEFNHLLCSALIDMFAKCGRIEVARMIFDATGKRQVSVWNSMITGLAVHGLAWDAVRVFDAMDGAGVSPDGITFVGLLTVCSHCGMVEEGQHYFDVMKSKYLIEPRIEHYGALVDALARAGRLEEAYETVRSMPMNPDIMMWRTLLSACRKHQRPALAELAIRQMERCGSGDYVLLSSIYSSAKRWDSAERIWGLMKERKVRKSSGLSWTEIGGMVHQFKAGDRSHPESNKIARVLSILTERVKAEGFVPVTELVSMDVSEEEKEENLNCHSEKLAVAYNILKTGPGIEIRVSKNLQTCSDCHEWMKMVSKVTYRIIIVRDRLRFHQFEKGSCSCRDYW